MVNKKIEDRIDLQDYYYALTNTNYSEWTYSKICQILSQIGPRQHSRNLNKFCILGYMEKKAFWDNNKLKTFRYKFTGKFPLELQFLETEYRIWMHRLILNRIEKFKEDFEWSGSYINMISDISEMYYKR